MPAGPGVALDGRVDVRRLFWLALGATTAVLIMRKLSRAAEKLTPQGIAGSIGTGLSDLAESIGSFAADVRDAMQSREAELRDAAGLDSDPDVRTSA
jgi:hypothetical protein